MTLVGEIETERLLAVDEVARRLDMSPDTVRTMSLDGRFIPPLRVGKLIRWREADLNEWIAARGVAAKQIVAAAAKSVEPQKRARRSGE